MKIMSSHPHPLYIYIYIYIYKGIYTDTDMNLYMDGLHTTYELLNTFLDKNSTLEHYVNLLIYNTPIIYMFWNLHYTKIFFCNAYNFKMDI
ncbi:hypothetical protein [Plasmodium yoelii yoelii]|uniref:Uncharacterized protein n=1 Tax=Plasmodium yoelii yoelii TaxID=73239 RepID=Q7RQQ9_PLAYO|nr:hypothetical protein [Plasmodium yoelii yoelii]